MQLAVLGAAIGLSLLVALLVAARRRPGAVVSPLIPALGFFLVGFPVFFYLTRRLTFGGYGERWAAVAFHDAVYLDAAAAAVGIGAAAAALLIVALRTANQIRLLGYALPCAMIGVALTSVKTHSESITSVGYMPFYGTTDERDMHVGRERDVKVALLRPAGRRFLFWSENGPQPVDPETSASWSPVASVNVRASAKGKVRFEAVAHRGAITLTSKLEVQAIPETASPLLSLRVGNRFVYRVRAKSADGAFLFFITLDGRESIHELTLEVIGTRERGRFRTFVIEVQRDGQSSLVEVVALGGETRAYDAAHDKVGEEIVSSAGQSLPPYDSSRRDLVACSFPLLQAGSAICQRGGQEADVPATASSEYGTSTPSRTRRGKTRNDVGRPPVAFAAAAPAAFEKSTSSAGGTFATVFVAIVTVGLVILPDGSSSTAYTLVSTHRGPEGAAEATPG